VKSLKAIFFLTLGEIMKTFIAVMVVFGVVCGLFAEEVEPKNDDKPKFVNKRVEDFKVLCEQLVEQPRVVNKGLSPFAKVVIEGFILDKGKDAKDALNRYFAEALKDAKEKNFIERKRLPELFLACNANALLELLQSSAGRGGHLRTDIAYWLFCSDVSLQQFVDVVTAKDKLKDCFGIIQLLYSSNPAQAERMRNLILAIATVWDGKRFPVHKQMNNHEPHVRLSPVVYYNYFSNLYGSNLAAVPYSMLSVSDLIFVVDVSVPIEELQWAVANCKEPASKWWKYYDSIKLDKYRLRKRQGKWPHKQPYILPQIKSKGGLSCDRAYFCLLSARANGIPAIYASGYGKDGLRAWVSICNEKRFWMQNIGRAKDVIKGNAINPQTGVSMGNYEQQFIYNINRKGLAYSRQLQRFAKLLSQKDCKNLAVKYADLAIKAYPFDIQAWETRDGLFDALPNINLQLSVFEAKVKNFFKFPKIVMDTRKKQAEILKKCGRFAEAEQLLLRAKAEISNRQDLSQDLFLTRMKQRAEAGFVKEVKMEMENMLMAEAKERRFHYSVLDEYLKITQNSGQTREAARFVKQYVNRLKRTIRDKNGRNKLLTYLLKAYINDHDKTNIRLLQQKLNHDRKR